MAYSIVLDIILLLLEIQGAFMVRDSELLDLLPGAGGKDETLTGGRPGPRADELHFQQSKCPMRMSQQSGSH